MINLNNSLKLLSKIYFSLFYVTLKSRTHMSFDEHNYDYVIVREILITEQIHIANDMYQPRLRISRIKILTIMIYIEDPTAIK